MGASKVGNKSICLPVLSEAAYETLISNAPAFRRYLELWVAKHPEIFPLQITAGFWFHDFVTSRKLNLRMRRIRLVETGKVYQLRPEFVMPYMVGKTDEVEKALYLRRYGVPFDALAYVFGRDASYWYRLHQSLGRFSIVGTTVKDPNKMPVNLVGDEKHSWLLGERIYIPTTVAAGCILGVDVTASADTEALVSGYQCFRSEARALHPGYQPQTVNTDGWDHTQAAWQTLFPGITIVLCFLHVVLDIQQRCRRTKPLWQKLTGRLWHVYQAATKRHFAQRLRRLRAWATTHVKQKTVRQKLLNLRVKSPKFQAAYAFPDAYRTSNALDRLMNYQDRLLYNMQYFHGTLDSARLHLRAMALLWNFHPYGSRTKFNHPSRSSPFQDLNGFQYHDNWLHNLLIASSLNGQRPIKQVDHKIR
jgi:hypothetical protein